MAVEKVVKHAEYNGLEYLIIRSGIMETDKIIKSISDTGFVLEYNVARLFEENGWSVINNRYYLDDDSQKSREIDIIAYKVSEINETLYYTTLIISCKKSKNDIWTFLIKDLNEKDPNIDKHPITDWSNNTVISFMKERQEFKKKIIKGIEDNENAKYTYEVDEQIFAFQQLNKNKYKLNNDKDIYNSIITSIKALEYERNALGKRIDRDSVYNFNIISVFDGDMYSLKYNGESDPVVKEIDDIKYLNRHIVNKVESFYRVHFISYNSLKEIINHYDGLHDWHLKIYSELKEDYQKIISKENNESALELLLNDFKKEVNYTLYNFDLSERVDINSLKFNEDKTMKVNCDIKDATYKDVKDSVKYFNENEAIQEEVKAALIKIYGYKGDFYFYNDALPF